MDKFGIKSTTYDVLGYLIPGLIFLLWIVYKYHPFSMSISFILEQRFSAQLIFALLAYLVGHILSAIGSYIFEGPALKFVRRMLGNKISINAYEKMFGKTIAIEPFGTGENGIRNAIVRVQTKNPIAYETAFVFLAFYGMIRNMLVAIIIIYVESFVLQDMSLGYKAHIIIIFVMLLCYYHYRRFQSYFASQINAGNNDLTTDVADARMKLGTTGSRIERS
jgi:hypothetical protein